MRPGVGLSPSPEEITFSCSCPDAAAMCKYVAATLCGIGARLDARAFSYWHTGDDHAIVGETVNDLVADSGAVIKLRQSKYLTTSSGTTTGRSNES